MPTRKENALFAGLLQPFGFENLRLLVGTNADNSCNCVLFLRTILAFAMAVRMKGSCPVIQSYTLQEAGSVVFSTSWRDHNSFGHHGAPLMGVFVRVQLRSFPQP